ncbi:MAG: hypothetical protein RIT45_1369 [Pseudomonadota bacterium]|jgi:arsenate reductase
MAPTPTVFHYPGCSTCKKALRWLEAAGVSVEPVDIVLTPPDRATLAAAVTRSGLPIERFFNTSGQSYRQGGFSARLPGMSLGDKLDALAADGKLIKRPLLIGAAGVLVGFKQPEWEAMFGG